MKVQLDNFI